MYFPVAHEEYILMYFHVILHADNFLSGKAAQAYLSVCLVVPNKDHVVVITDCEPYCPTCIQELC